MELKPDGTVLVGETISVKITGDSTLDQKTIQISWELQEDHLGDRIASLIDKTNFQLAS